MARAKMNNTDQQTVEEQPMMYEIEPEQKEEAPVKEVKKVVNQKVCTA